MNANEMMFGPVCLLILNRIEMPRIEGGARRVKPACKSLKMPSSSVVAWWTDRLFSKLALDPIHSF